MVQLTRDIITRGRDLREPYVRVIIGDDQFTLGDGRLTYAQVHLNEGKTASHCTFKIYDPDRLWVDKYFTTIYEADGLAPLVIPTRKNSRSTSRTSSSYTALRDASPYVKATLDLIGWAEGASYNTLFGGGTFDDFSDHPRQEISGSTAAGRYQFLSKDPNTWDEVKNALGLPDFSPESQDLAAIWLLDTKRGVLGYIEDGDLTSALPGLSCEWASLPPDACNYGQARFSEAEVIAYWEERVRFYERQGNQAAEDVKDSVQEAAKLETDTKKPKYETLAGQQVTIIMGYDGQEIVAYSYLHTGLDFSLFDTSELVFTGQAANWVMGQKSKNTVYQKVTLKQIAQRICETYGLNLDMPESGPFYEFFPQYGKSDYSFLFAECRRIGYRIYCEGNTLYIRPRKAENSGFVLKYGYNLGKTFTVSHKAQSDYSSGGARASEPSERHSTGELKFYVDEATGEMVQQRVEDPTGTGKEQSSSAIVSTTGSHLSKIEPRTDGATDSADTMRRENEMRIKGIVANFSMPTTPEALLLNPDSVFMTEGISKFLDRIWVIESITHTYERGSFTTEGTCYTPLKNRFPQPVESESRGSGSSDYSGASTALSRAFLDLEGSDSSAGPGGGNLACVWAVNKAFRKAGLAVPWGDDVVSVPSAEEWLRSNAQAIDPSEAQPGDIVIASGQQHIGIVVEPGTVLSNSSSRAAISWRSSTDFDGSYRGASRVYRLPNN